MDIGIILGAIIGIAIGTVVNGILIFVVGKLKLGMEVANFGSAFLAGLVVAVGAALAALFWRLTGGTPTTGVVGAVMNLIVAAAVLLVIGNSLKGITVKGWSGALVAAVAIAALAWLISLVLTPMVAN